MFFCLTLIGAYFFFVDKLSEGYVDDYYNKFTQEAGSLVLGLSRGEQGIVPDIVEETFHGQIQTPVINFATNQSSYGEAYLRAVKRKLGINHKKGLFILSVTPGNFTAPQGMSDEEIIALDENTPMGKMDDFISSPNYEYIIDCYAYSLYNVFNPYKSQGPLLSHKNGWNEIRIDENPGPVVENDIANWKALTKKYYKRKLKEESISQYRIQSFIKTLNFLKEYGNVVMVRMPADVELIHLENDNWKDFDTKFDSIAKKHDVPYLNYSRLKDSLKTYDGSHLVSKSAKRFTRILSDDIDNLLVRQKTK